MHRALRTCLFSADPQTGQSVLAALGELPRMEVVARAACWEELRDCVANGEIDLVVATLDPDLDESLGVIQMLAQQTPDMGIVGVSERTDPQTIIKAMRMGCAQFVCAPIEVADLENAVSRVEATRTTLVPTSHRVCVIGSAGGVGATTIACNLALELANATDRPTSLVDLNLDFGDAAAAFDAVPKYSVADVCRSDLDVDRTLVEAALHTLPCKVHLLARPTKLDEAHLVSPDGIARALHVLAASYPFVVVDLPRSCTSGNAAAIEDADAVLVVTQLQVASIRNAHRVVESLLQMGADEDKIELVLNRVKADHERIKAADVEESFGRPVFATVPNDYRNVAAALDLGHPIQMCSPASPARIAIQEMARKIARAVNGQPPAATRRRGLFGRWLGKKAAAK